MNWISVEDELPKISGDYLVYNPSSAYSKRYVATWFATKWSNSNGFITHWMPLPEPPDNKQ